MTFILWFLLDIVAIYAIFKGVGLLFRLLGDWSDRLGDSVEYRIANGRRRTKRHDTHRTTMRRIVDKDGTEYWIEDDDD